MKTLTALLCFCVCISNPSCAVVSLYNAALYKPAWQSSTAGNKIPNWGNDGNTNTINAVTYVFSETYEDDPAWWMVDLKGQYVTEEIILTNRDDVDDVAHRLRNFQIDVFKTDPRQLDNFLTVSGDVCFNRTDPVDGGTFTWKCTTPITGRYVRLIRYTKEYLNVVELQVMVSRELFIFTSFTRHLDSILDKPFIVSGNVSSPMECAQRCLKLGSESRCTAFNWILSNHQCQMLSIDARLKDAVVSRLRSLAGVSFYME